MFLLRTRSAMRSSRRALLTWYGSSVTMIAWRPPFSRSSKCARARIESRPRPPLYAATISCAPLMMPAVGKSGPGTICISPASEMDGSSSTARQALTISVRLCGGILVAMPTAMPDEPFSSRLGTRVGSTEGSCSDSS